MRLEIKSLAVRIPVVILMFDISIERFLVFLRFEKSGKLDEMGFQLIQLIVNGEKYCM